MKATALGFIALLVLSNACTTRSICAKSLQDDRAANLSSIRRIFIEEVPNIKIEGKVEPFLKRELQRWGFIVVEDRVGADAMLTGTIKAEIIVDGDGSVPDKAVYEYELRLTNNDLVWKGKIKFPMRRSFAEENEYAAQKIAEKIANDWKRAVKKGAKK